MNTAPSPIPLRHRAGMTLLELTVVILVLLTLIAVMFVGVHAWKKGANRTTCILNIRTVQMAVRGYGNVNGLEPGQTTAVTLKDELIGSDKRISTDPDCPAGGAYSFAGNTIPAIGSLYMTCSLSTALEHAPRTPASW